VRRPKDLLGPIGPDKIEHRARDDAAIAFDTSPRNVQPVRWPMLVGA
jgi:hypothetical protein